MKGVGNNEGGEKWFSATRTATPAKRAPEAVQGKRLGKKCERRGQTSVHQPWH